MKAVLLALQVHTSLAQLIAPQQTFQPPVPQVAIIGAGPGGSSSSYFLSFFRNLTQFDTDVTIFEKSHHVGGRSTVISPWNENIWQVDENEEPVEAGASVFVDANRNMVKAASEFGLEYKEKEYISDTTAIWDGEKIVIQMQGGYWDYAKLFWRYGRAPLRAQRTVKKAVNKFLSLYSPEFISNGPFSTLSEFINRVNFTTELTRPAQQYFVNEGAVDKLFVDEIIAASTGVNYGTRVQDIHALGGLVSMAASGAHTIKNGNRQIFENFAIRGDAKIKFGESGHVTHIVKLDGESSAPKWIVYTKDEGAAVFDAVIFAAPFHQSNITIFNSKARVPYQNYVPLYVNFIITPTPGTALNASYFGLPEGAATPSCIYATFDTQSKEPEFNSLNYLKELSPETSRRLGEEKLFVVKMFSKARLSHEWLESMFGKVTKAESVLFYAYPVLDPLAEHDLADIKLDNGLYYLNGFERVISTMETATVSAYNGVSLLMQDLFAYTPNTSWAEW